MHLRSAPLKRYLKKRALKRLTLGWMSFLYAFLVCRPTVFVTLFLLSGLASAKIDIKIEGLEAELEDNARAFLSLEKLEPPYNERRLRRLYRDGSDEIRQALVPFGYYNAKVKREIQSEGKSWKVLYIVEPGVQTTVKALNISIDGEGKNNRMIEIVLENKRLQEGKPLLHEQYDSLKKSINNAAVTRGYVRGRFEEHEIRVDTQANTAVINLLYDTGPRYFFGDITISQDILHDDFVKGFINLNRSNAFNTDQLLKTQLTLSNTNYFKTAYADADIPSIESGDRFVPITIETEAADRFQYLTSLGYGTDTGARLGLGYSDHRINRSGHQFDSRIEISQVELSANAQYKIPFGNPQTDFYDIFVDTRSEEVNRVDTTNYSLGTSYNIGIWKGLARLALTAERENYQFGNGPQQRAELLVPFASFLARSADDEIFPRSGYSYQVSLAGGIEALYSETSFVQLSAQARWVKGISDNLRLLTRAEGGTTWTDEFSELPPSYRFFTGGAQTVRGYGYKNISPLDDDNVTTGGRNYFASAVEVDWLFKGNFGMATFVDAGDSTEAEKFDVKLGAGFGFRYRSPIGMVRLDLAHPFDDDENAVRFHLSIGPDL